MGNATTRKKLVIIAEDDAALRSLFQQALERDGHAVLPVGNGRELVALVEEILLRGGRGGSIDLIISDIRMPEMDGLAALARLRASCGRVPVVLMTAFGDSASAKAAAGLQAALLSKPVGLRHLRDVVESTFAA